MEHGPITQILTHKETIRWKPCGLHRRTTPTVEIPKATAALVRGLRATQGTALCLDNEAKTMPEDDWCHASLRQYRNDQLTAPKAT
jgi:hypothetical protein